MIKQTRSALRPRAENIFYQVSLPALMLFWLLSRPNQFAELRCVGSGGTAGGQSVDQLQYHEACWVRIGAVWTWLHGAGHRQLREINR